MAEEITKGRTLPHNLDAERSVLGAILLDNAAVNPAGETLTPEDFYGEAHRVVFEAMVALSEDSSAIDPVTVAERLERSSQLERAGGLGYLSTLMDGLPRALKRGAVRPHRQGQGVVEEPHLVGECHYYVGDRGRRGYRRHHRPGRAAYLRDR